MKTKIHIVRHGEVHNPTQVVYGRLPGFGLSEKGKQEAAALGQKLKKKKLTAIYASPLTRAQETASYIAKHFPDLQVITEERVIEVFSPMDGKPNSLMYARKWNFYTKDLIDKGGETLADLWKRMSAFLKEVRRKHAGEEIAIVSHGDPIMVVRAKHEGKRLQVPSIRGKTYVNHAQGFTLVFEEETFVGLEPII